MLLYSRKILRKKSNRHFCYKMQVFDFHRIIRFLNKAMQSNCNTQCNVSATRKDREEKILCDPTIGHENKQTKNKLQF